MATAVMKSGTLQAESNPTGSTVRVLIAASSSGGHLIPALHIANAIRAIDSSAQVEFIGAGKPLEEKLLVQRGMVRHIIAAVGIKHRGLRGIASFLVSLPRAVSQILRLFKTFRPTVVVGVGGYVSVLPVVLARLRGVPTWAHEAEKHPGLANRALGFFARNFSVAFEGTRIRGASTVLVTGHPVRPELAAVDRETLRVESPKRLLVLGGSQGARGLDEAVRTIAPVLAERGMEVVHQSRPDAIEAVLREYKSVGVPAHVVSFIDDMAGAYDWADIIISRAGAGSVAEIACVNRPTIFVPYPHQQGTHQTDNAKTLVVQEKALLVEERQPDFVVKLREALVEICSPKNFQRMKMAPSAPRGLTAAAEIAQAILKVGNH